MEQPETELENPIPIPNEDIVHPPSPEIPNQSLTEEMEVVPDPKEEIDSELQEMPQPELQPEPTPEVKSPAQPTYEPINKNHFEFAFKFIKQSILTALEETETALASLTSSENAIPTEISEQELMIMEETAQVRSKVARQLIKSLKSYRPLSKPTKYGTEENYPKDEDADSVPPLSPVKLGSKLVAVPVHKYYKCKLCKSRFHKHTLLKYHIRSSHYKLSFVCTKCHNHFQSKQRLHHHRCPVANAEIEEPPQQEVPPQEPQDPAEEDQGVESEFNPIHTSESLPGMHHLPHHAIKYERSEHEDHHMPVGESQELVPDHHRAVVHPPREEDEVMGSPKLKQSPSNTSGASSRSAHSSNEDSPKGRERTSSCTPTSSPEDNENAPREYRNGNISVDPQMRNSNIPYNVPPEVNYYIKDSPDTIRDHHRTFFPHRRDLHLPPIPLHRFDTAFGNPLPSIAVPRASHPQDSRPHYENGSISNLPSPIPTTQPLQTFLGKEKNLPLLNNLNIQKNNAFITQLIAASCIPTPSSTSNIFTSQSTPTSSSAFGNPESGNTSTSPTEHQYQEPPPVVSSVKPSVQQHGPPQQEQQQQQSQQPQSQPPQPPQQQQPPQQAGQQQSQPSSGNTSSSNTGSGGGTSGESGNVNQFLDYKKYSCKICHRKFSQRSSLNRHVYTIHWNMKIKCAFCTKTYTQKCLLKQHVYEEHGVEACLQMFSANERINWKMQLVNSQKQRLNMSLEEDQENKAMKQEASSS